MPAGAAQPFVDKPRADQTKSMAFRSLRLLAPLLMLLSSGKSTEDGCTLTDLENIKDCISNHAAAILLALLGSASCDHGRITPLVCQSFEAIVTCITEHESINQTTCVPNAPAEINPYLSEHINCSVGDFFHVCTDVHNPWGFGISNSTIPPENTGHTSLDNTSSTTITTGGDDGTGGCGRKSVTQYLWVTSLMTTFLAMTIASADEF